MATALAPARRATHLYLDGRPYRLLPGSYQVETLPRFSSPLRLGSPRYEHAFAETVFAQSSWHKGWGQGRFGDPEMYAVADGVDASLPGLITLAPPLTLVDSTLTSVVSFAIFLGQLYAAQGTSLLRYNAATGTWSSVATLPAAITDLQTFRAPAGPRLCIGQATGNFRLWDGSLLSDGGVPATLLTVVNEALWRVYQDSSLGWSVAKSADAITWGGPVRVGDGTQQPTALLVYESRLFVVTPSGIWAINNDGSSENLLPDFAMAMLPDLGKGSAVHGNVVYVPAGGSLLEWQSGVVTATGLGRGLAASEPLGLSVPDAVAGTYVAVQGITPRTVMALLNGQAGCRLLLRRTPAPPGLAWHPIASLPNQGGRAIFAEGVTDSTAITVWVAASGGLYRLKWPKSDVVRDGWPLAQTGDITLSALDMGMPAFAKVWGRLRITASIPDLASVEVYFSTERAAERFLTSRSGPWEGSFEVSFPSDAASSSLRLRLRLVRQSAQTVPRAPRITEIAITGEPRPGVRRQWRFVLLVAEESSPSLRAPGPDQITHLRSLLTYEGPVAFRDLDGVDYKVLVDDLSLREVLKEGERAAVYQAAVSLRELSVVSSLAWTYSQMSNYTYSQLGNYTYGQLMGGV